MQRLTRQLLATTALIGALGTLGAAHASPHCDTAMASPHSGQHGGPRAERMQAQMDKRQTEHQERLKTALKLTPTQESAWKSYVQASQRPPRPNDPKPDWATLTTPQRLDQLETWQQMQQKHAQQRISATREFYAGLSPEQQKVFDTQSLPRKGPQERRERRD